MPTWIPRTTRRIRELAGARRVRFTLKAAQELAVLGLDADDGADLLASVTPADAYARLRSTATGEWMYVLKPRVSGVVLYVKVIIREDCIVVSFHEDEPNDEQFT